MFFKWDIDLKNYRSHLGHLDVSALFMWSSVCFSLWKTFFTTIASWVQYQILEPRFSNDKEPNQNVAEKQKQTSWWLQPVRKILAKLNKKLTTCWKKLPPESSNCSKIPVRTTNQQINHQPTKLPPEISQPSTKHQITCTLKSFKINHQQPVKKPTILPKSTNQLNFPINDKKFELRCLRFIGFAKDSFSLGILRGEATGWTHWGEHRSQAIPHRIHVWYIYLHLP